MLPTPIVLVSDRLNTLYPFFESRLSWRLHSQNQFHSFPQWPNNGTTVNHSIIIYIFHYYTNFRFIYALEERRLMSLWRCSDVHCFKRQQASGTGLAQCPTAHTQDRMRLQISACLSGNRLSRGRIDSVFLVLTDASIALTSFFPYIFFYFRC